MHKENEQKYYQIRLALVLKLIAIDRKGCFIMMTMSTYQEDPTTTHVCAPDNGAAKSIQ